MRRTPDGFDEKKAREIAERDWDQDRRVDDAARKHRAMGVVDLRRFELSLLQLADAWADARTDVQVKKAARDAREAGRRVGVVCRNVAVATTLWNLLEAVSVVDDDEVRVWRWRFYREPLVKKKKAKPVAAPQKKSVVAPPQKKKTITRAPLWLASHKRRRRLSSLPSKARPRSASGRRSLVYIRRPSPPSRSSGRLLWFSPHHRSGARKRHHRRHRRHR